VQRMPTLTYQVRVLQLQAALHRGCHGVLGRPEARCHQHPAGGRGSAIPQSTGKPGLIRCGSAARKQQHPAKHVLAPAHPSHSRSPPTAQSQLGPPAGTAPQAAAPLQRRRAHGRASPGPWPPSQPPWLRLWPPAGQVMGSRGEAAAALTSCRSSQLKPWGSCCGAGLLQVKSWEAVGKLLRRWPPAG